MLRTSALVAAAITPLAIAAIAIAAMVMSAANSLQTKALINGQFLDRADNRSASPIVARA